MSLEEQLKCQTASRGGISTVGKLKSRVDAPPHRSALDGTVFSPQSCVTVGAWPSRGPAPGEEEAELPEDGTLSRTPGEVIARGVAVAQVLADRDAFHLKNDIW